MAWRTRFPEAAVRHLPRIGSDHTPLLIALEGIASYFPGNKPFRFLAAWMSHNQFEEFVRDKWTQNGQLVQNLSALASELTVWNREVFGNLYRKKWQLWARIEGIQKKLEVGAPRFLLKLERSLRQELNRTLDQIATMWFQKARVDQIRDGDRNTKYFHMSTILRRRINRIEALRDHENNWCTEADQIKRLVVDYFRDLFSSHAPTEDAHWPVTLDFPTLEDGVVHDLERPFTVEDIKAALKEMQPYKAPGPDGFQAIFYQRYWHIVHGEVCPTVLQVLHGEPMPAQLNETFITLIPKVPHPERINQFRPIGLCNVTYKLVSKCIVQRLKRVLPQLISPTQSSFVPGRQITDNVIIMQEMLHSMRRKKGNKGWLAIKLDLEKAYDRLRWDFIEDTLIRMRLPDQLVRVIMTCVSSCMLNILWNGEPTEQFQPTHGIRQGDPLSPYLFVACMERLTQLIEQKVIEGTWKPIPITREGIRVSHLMFADDVVLFGEASATQAKMMKQCLQKFCAASGQRISYQKSRIFFSPNTNEAVIAEVCNTLDIQQTMDFGRYLGVPTLHGRTTKATYYDVLDKVEKRLAGWKTKCLSLAGRATLIQSTVTAIPAYVMQSARLPRSVCDDLDRKIRRFLWGGTAMQRKLHLVAWDAITKEKAQGGLGIRGMRQLNAAYLMKLG